MTNLASQYRHLFPVLEKVTYFNSCSQGALAIPVREALNEYLDGMDEKGSLWDQWVSKYEELRALVGVLFDTNPSNVAITTTASAGINSILSSLDFSGPRRRIVTTDLEFPTMGQILHAHERHGAEILHVPTEADGSMSYTKLEEALDDNVALVAVTHVCYQNSARIDIKRVSALAQNHKIPVLVDSSQSSGSMQISFDQSGADFMVGGFLKYLLGIPGVGFLIARPNLDLVPIKTGWFAAENIFDMEHRAFNPAKTARRFEEGTPPVPSVFAAYAGLRLLQEVGLENVETSLMLQHQRLLLALEGIGRQIVSPMEAGRHGSMVVISSKDSEMEVHRLANFGVVVSSRGGNIRISPHFYNSEEDMDRLIEALLQVGDIS